MATKRSATTKFLLRDGKRVSSEANFILLPNGTQLHDAFVWPNFMQNALQIDPEEIWRDLLTLPTWPEDKPIPFRQRGDDPHWIPGTHRALNYRGRAVKRRKIWCEANYASGLRKYRYTGWQWAISRATHDARFVEPVSQVANALNRWLRVPHNHWIVTCYDDQNDNIGFHADKSTDFAIDSCFVVLKLGAPRRFAFRVKRTALEPNPDPLFSEVLSPGTAVFCGANREDGLDANNILEHGVPPMDAPCGPSGSIVGRTISTVIPWRQVNANIERSGRDLGSRREGVAT